MKQSVEQAYELAKQRYRQSTGTNAELPYQHALLAG